MRKMIVALVAVNAFLLLAILFIHGRGTDSVSLTEDGIATLHILPELPGSKYSASKAEGASSCFTIGPYYSEKAAQLVAGNIRNAGLAVTIRSMNTRETLNYLVYIANLPSYEAARKVMVDLEKQNAGQHEIIKEGPYKNTITFGFFKNLERAKRKTEYIRYLGYDARFNGQKVTRKVFWVDYDEPMGAAIPALSWSQSIDPASHAQIIPRNCDQQVWYGSRAFADSAYTN